MTNEACPICGAENIYDEDRWREWDCGREQAGRGRVMTTCPQAEAEVLRLRAEVEQWKTVSAAGVRPDIHAWMVRDRDRLRAQLDGVVAAVEAEPVHRAEQAITDAKASIIARIKGGGE